VSHVPKSVHEQGSQKLKRCESDFMKDRTRHWRALPRGAAQRLMRSARQGMLVAELFRVLFALA
jgi:hypothetical protein